MSKTWVKVSFADGRVYFTAALTRTGKGAVTVDVGPECNVDLDKTSLSDIGRANYKLACVTPGKWVREQS